MQLKFSKAGWVCIIFGALLIIPGFLLLFVAAPAILRKNPGDEDVFWIYFAGGILIGIGVLIMSIRGGTRIDLESRAVHHWWGFAVFGSRKERSLDDFDHIFIDRDQPGDRGVHYCNER